KLELTRILCKHVVADCWNMALNDRAAPPPETWDQVLGEVYMSNNTFATQASCLVRSTKEEKKEVSHEDEPFVKDGKLKASGSASRQAQQTEPAAGQDGSVGSGAGIVIGLSTTVGEGGQGGAGVAI
ncbi:hypothetical protein Tco_0765523, partial [Tanacetum coccineum]